MHVRGFEPEQIYQQLKSINDARLKPFIGTLVKGKTKQKSFGKLLRPPSPEPPAIDEFAAQDENGDDVDDEPELEPKKPVKKKKSVT